MLTELTDDNFEKEVLENCGIVLVDFYAQWCSPCKVLAKTIEELSDEEEGTVVYCKADIEQNSNAVQKLGINSVPFVAVYKDGEIVDKHIGLRSKQDLQNDIQKAM